MTTRTKNSLTGALILATGIICTAYHIQGADSTLAEVAHLAASAGCLLIGVLAIAAGTLLLTLAFTNTHTR